VPALAKSYAPIGLSPEVHPFLTRDHLSVISAVTPAPQLYANVSLESFKSAAVALFLQHLLECIGGPLLVFWDGSPIHHGPEIDAFVARVGRSQIIFVTLPAYAPDVNPDEGVWNYLKYVELRNLACSSRFQLRFHLQRAIMRLRSKPAILLSFFDAAGLPLDDL
jgi:transposase